MISHVGDFWCILYLITCPLEVPVVGVEREAYINWSRLSSWFSVVYAISDNATARPDGLWTRPMSYIGSNGNRSGNREGGWKPVSEHQIQPRYGE